MLATYYELLDEEEFKECREELIEFLADGKGTPQEVQNAREALREVEHKLGINPDA